MSTPAAGHDRRVEMKAEGTNLMRVPAHVDLLLAGVPPYCPAQEEESDETSQLSAALDFWTHRSRSPES